MRVGDLFDSRTPPPFQTFSYFHYDFDCLKTVDQLSIGFVSGSIKLAKSNDILTMFINSLVSEFIGAVIVDLVSDRRNPLLDVKLRRVALNMGNPNRVRSPGTN